MNITQDTAVTLNYKVTSPTGQPLDQGTLAYLHGGYDNIFAKVEAALAGQAAGFATTVDLAVDDAFGPRDESLVRVIPKSEFPPGVKVGGHLQGPGADGQPQSFRVVKIKGPEVHLDGNHPLAGQALRFACKVVSVRAASVEEIAHRHVHGAHGHHH
ncbi:peptidylprolyl isomerase [Acidovorax lacteus]|uniref:peptidylprolyl isomerase n=1 Tax=Acidovorax lacteus TaxID=1924988 RepID=A0ABP8LCN9_9BURK